MIKLLKHWKVIVICIATLGMGAYIGSKLMTPIYQSTVFIQIAIGSGGNQIDYNSLLASDQLVQTEAVLATSSTVLKEVASHYPGLSAQQLTKEVTASPTVNTQLFEIDIRDSNAERAANLANDIATTLIKQQTQLTQQGSTKTLQQLQLDLQQTQQQINSVTNQIDALQGVVGKQTQIATLDVQLYTLQQHYGQVQTALVQLELTQSQNGNFLLIVQSAQPALAPVQPNILLNTGAGLLAGFLLGISLALIFEQLDTRVRTQDVLSQILGCPVLTTIVHEQKNEVVNPMGNNPNVEAYRILRTNIGFSAIDKPLRIILITSAVSGEGKSVVAANLAIFMAKAGKNTLLVDTDLHRPSQHNQFGLLPNQNGLSNAIVALNMMTTTNSFSHHQFALTTSMRQSQMSLTNFSLEPFMHSVSMPNLRVMPSGPLPPNPSEFLDSKAMQHLWTSLNDCGADVVIIDAPPLLGGSDASILASKVDGVLVVVDITSATRGNLERMKIVLKQTGANVLGAVINKQRRGRNDVFYYSVAQDEDGSDHENTPAIPIISGGASAKYQ
jgi:non-specific protein-tyrosine kinase